MGCGKDFCGKHWKNLLNETVETALDESNKNILERGEISIVTREG